MSRRLTGWVLTAAAIAASPAPALSSNDSLNVSSNAQSLAGDDRDYTDCMEVAPPPNLMALRDDKVLILQQPYPASSANAIVRFENGMAGDTDELLLGAIDRSKRSGAGRAILPWPSMPEGKLLPEGKLPAGRIEAACGIPKGLTLLEPASEISPTG